MLKNTHIFNISPVCSVAPHSGPTQWPHTLNLEKIIKKSEKNYHINYHATQGQNVHKTKFRGPPTPIRGP